MSIRTSRSKRTRLANRRRLAARPVESLLVVTPEAQRAAQPTVRLVTPLKPDAFVFEPRG